MHLKSIYSLLAFFLISNCTFAQNQGKSIAGQILNTVEYNTQSEINIEESKLLEKISDSRSSTITLPFIDQELTFSKSEFSIFGGEGDPEGQIRTFRVTCKEDPLLQGRIVTGALGISITYLYNGKLVKIYSDDSTGARKYFQQVGPKKETQFSCGNHDDPHHEHYTPTVSNILDKDSKELLRSVGASRRLYRVAVACTGEFYQGNGGNANSARMAATTLLTDISMFFEREANIELRFSSGSPRLFTDPGSDPFPGTGAQESQREIPKLFNNNSYDVGHTFHTLPSGGSGTAGVGVVCLNTDRKAAGWSGFSTCLLYTSPSPRDATLSRMPSSA